MIQQVLDMSLQDNNSITDTGGKLWELIQGLTLCNDLGILGSIFPLA